MTHSQRFQILAFISFVCCFSLTLKAQIRYADSVISYSSQYSANQWSADQILGPPDVYPRYGDLGNAWAPIRDVGRQFIELYYSNPAPVQSISVYETYTPGAIDTIYVKNPSTGQWVTVWSGTAAPLGVAASRIFTATFVRTSFNVSQVRIAINDPAVPGWNEFDAVAISVTASAPNQPDLAASQVEAPFEAWTNQTIDVTWLVKNLGSLTTGSVKWTDRVYLSPNPTLDVLSVSLKEDHANVSSLVPGQSYAGKASTTIPHGLKGNYYYYVFADVGNVIAESLETNNIARSTVPILIHLSPEPDLMVTSFSAPSIAFAGDTINVTYTVKNIGRVATATGYNWIDRFFFSKDTVLISSNATLVASVAHNGVLNPDSSYRVSASVVVPRTLSGAYYLYLSADALNSVFENLIESNNIMRSPAMQIVTVRPDLQVTAVTVPASGASGQTMQMEWTVRNAGAGGTFATSWGDRVYYSTNPVFDQKLAGVLGSFIHTGTLAPDGSYHVVQSLVLPNGMAGQFYVYVQADYGGDVFEKSTATQRVLRSTQPVSITLSPWPDLRVSGIQVPSTANAGREISITWTVENKGSAATPNHLWNDQIYISHDSAFGTSAVRLGDVPHPASLAADARYTETGTVIIPPTISGNVYFYIWSDGDNVVYEQIGPSTKRTRSAFVLVAPYPQIDLSVAALSVPDTVAAGQMIEVQWTVKNIGGGRTLVDRWTDVFYMSRYATFKSDSSVQVARFDHEGALDPGTSYSRTVQAKVPDGVAGVYYFFLATDNFKESGDSVFANNIRSTSKPVVLQLLPKADLTVTSVRTDDIVFAGQPTTVRWTVLNSSSGPALTPTWYDAVYLSPSGQLDKSAIKLEAHYHSGGLAAQASYSDSLRATIPLSLAGTNRVLVQTDINDVVAETNEGNNTGSAASVLRLAAPSDLIVTSVTAPDSAEPGDMLSVTYTVLNQGANPATGYLTDAFYVSTDTTWDVSDALLGTVYRSINVASGEIQKSTVHVRVAAIRPEGTTGTVIGELPGILPGPYHIIVRTDLRDNIPESNEVNNSYASASLTNVHVKKLTRNVAQPFSVKQDQSTYFSFTAQAGEDIVVMLDGDTKAGFNELFVSYADLPSRGNYDYLYQNQNSQNQQVTISSSKAGTYYALVRGQKVFGAVSACSILAKTLQFHVDSVQSPVAGIGGEVTVQIIGAAFKPGAFAQLRRAGVLAVRDNSDMLISSTQLNARFATAGMPEGKYDMAVVNPDGQEAVLQNAMTLQPGDPSQLLIALAGPKRMRVNSIVPMNIVANNPTNMNIQRALIQFKVRREMRFWVETDQSLFSSTPNTWSADSLVDDDGNRFFSVYLYNLAPKQTKMIRVLVEPTVTGHYIFMADAFVLDRITFDSLLVATVREATSQRWLPPPGSSLFNGFGKDGSVAKTTDGCPYDDAGVCEAWNHRERNKDIATDLGGVATAGAEASNVTSVSAGSGWKLYKFFRSLMDFFNKFKGSSGYAGDGVASLDPNDLVGPPGYGDEHWVSVGQTLPYTISFENDPAKANAPAQTVSISMNLDSTLNADSFRLTNFGFAGKTFSQTTGRGYFTQRLDCRDSLGLFVDVVAGVDVVQNSVFWTFKSIDPGTGNLPADPMIGLLPVNDAQHHGEGWVSYTIKPKAGAKTRDIVAPKAKVIFDANEPINTPSLFNTIDAGVPASSVQALPAQGAASPMTVSWTGHDDPMGSGIRSYSVYVSKNDSAFAPWLSNVVDTSAKFAGVLGSRYRFFSLAADNAGNIESIKAKAEASVVVTGIGKAEDVTPTSYWLEQNYPNPFNPSTTIRYGLKEQSNVRIDIYNVLGQRVVSLNLGMKNAGVYNETVDMSRYSSGVYIYRIDAFGAEGGRFVSVKKMMMLK